MSPQDLCSRCRSYTQTNQHTQQAWSCLQATPTPPSFFGTNHPSHSFACRWRQTVFWYLVALPCPLPCLLPPLPCQWGTAAQPARAPPFTCHPFLVGAALRAAVCLPCCISPASGGSLLGLLPTAAGLESVQDPRACVCPFPPLCTLCTTNERNERSSDLDCGCGARGVPCAACSCLPGRPRALSLFGRRVWLAPDISSGPPNLCC